MKISVIGYGVWGKKIVNTLQDITNVEIIYICKKTPNKGIESKNYEFVYDYKKAINENIDCVIICALPQLNFEIAKFAIEQKKHIFIEKPVCLKSNDYDELYKLSKINKTIIHVNYIHLFNSNFKIFKNKFSTSIMERYRAEICIGSPMDERKCLNQFYDWFPHIISMTKSIEKFFIYKIKKFKINKLNENKLIYHLTLLINNNEYKINFGNGFKSKITSFKIFKDDIVLEYSDKFSKYNDEIIDNKNSKSPLHASLQSFFSKQVNLEFKYKYDKTTKIMNDIYNKTFI